MLGAHIFQPGLLWGQSHTQGLIPPTLPISPPPLLLLHPALDRDQNDGTEQALGKYLLDGLLDGWMVGWMDRCWIDRWMDGRVDRWLDGWLKGCVDGCMDEWVAGWMNGWMSMTSILTLQW